MSRSAPQAPLLAPGGLTLREVHWSDLPQLAALERSLFPDDAWSEASWWAELALRPRRDYVVAEDAGGLLGYGGLDHGGETADVMTIAVALRGRGSGLGRALLAHLQVRAAARGAEQLMLEVRADNRAAIGLYEQEDFTTVHTRIGYYRPGPVDALVMRKPLGRAGVGHD